MAGLAAVDAGGGMFEGEGTALVGVAPEAGLFAASAGLDHAGAGTHAPGG